MAAAQRSTSYVALVFDPGLSNTGWTALELRPGEHKITVLKSGALQLTREVKRVAYNALTERYGVRVITLSMLEDELIKLFDTFNPDFVVTEDVFFNPCRPTAYAALLQWVTILERFALKQKRCVYRVPPKSAKKSLAGMGDADKNNIQEMLLVNEGIKFRHRSAIPDLTEHEADAIAIGWHFFEAIFPEAVQALITQRAEESEEQNSRGGQ